MPYANVRSHFAAVIAVAIAALLLVPGVATAADELPPPSLGSIAVNVSGADPVVTFGIHEYPPIAYFEYSVTSTVHADPVTVWPADATAGQVYDWTSYDGQGSITLVGATSGYVNIRAVGVDGQQGTVHHKDFNVGDRAAPTVPPSLTLVQTPGTHGVTATWGVSTDAGSGVARYEFHYAATPGAGQYMSVGEPGSLTRSVAISGRGPFTVHVTAVDAAGNRSAPATAGPFTLDLAAPTVTFTSGPAAGSRQTSSTKSVQFTVDEAAAITCVVGPGAYYPVTFTPCSSPVHVPSAASDTQTGVAVRVVDAFGNQAEYTHTWTVDGLPPSLEVKSASPKLTKFKEGAQSIYITARKPSDHAIGMTLMLDGKPIRFKDDYEGRTDMRFMTYAPKGLPLGSHTLEVTATDSLGQASKTSYSWVQIGGTAGTAPGDFRGGRYDDNYTGTKAGNWIDGGAGNDTLNGGGGPTTCMAPPAKTRSSVAQAGTSSTARLETTCSMATTKSRATTSTAAPAGTPASTTGATRSRTARRRS